MDTLQDLWFSVTTVVEKWWNTAPEYLIAAGAALLFVAYLSLTRNNPHRRARR